jgi:hypothetical protein
LPFLKAAKVCFNNASVVINEIDLSSLIYPQIVASVWLSTTSRRPGESKKPVSATQHPERRGGLS